jgi:hypothetical protein
MRQKDQQTLSKGYKVMEERYTSDLLWRSIDRIADWQKVSLPKLALVSKLDQSTFSHARRKRNWMSLQTLSKVLNAYNIDIKRWAEFVDEEEKALREDRARQVRTRKRRTKEAA